MTAKRRVLIVDDDAALLRLMSLRLEKEGFQVLEASSGEQALAILAAQTADLVISDMRMGGMDGLALFDAVSRTHPSLPVILLTAHGNIPDAVSATRRGVFTYSGIVRGVSMDAAPPTQRLPFTLRAYWR